MLVLLLSWCVTHVHICIVDECVFASSRLCLASANLWSPWFRIIVERFAREWWQHLSDALKTDKYVDTVNIHRFDPPARYRGGAGVTGLLEEGTATAKIEK